MKSLSLLVLGVVLSTNMKAQNTSQSIDLKVNDLVTRMTLEEKVGQMTQISIEAFLKANDKKTLDPHRIDEAKLAEAINKYKVGSILNVGGNAQTVQNWRSRIQIIQKYALKERLKIPVLYGVDAIRGNNYTLNSVMFPHQIAQAASFNPALTKIGAEITAYETRASFVPWNFSPVLDLGRQQLWPRIYETYGEDPYLAAIIGKAVVEGFQGNNQVTDKYHVAACLKHFLGYSMPLSGHDRTPAWIPERELREYFLPPFVASIKAGAKTVMINSAEINGIPVHANKHILTEILKDELRFRGFAVSDWQDIEYLYQRHRVARDNKEAVAMAINAGIDMSMVPLDYTFVEALIENVKEGKVPMSRIDDAVTRILRVKYEVGLFENPVGNAKDYPLFGSQAHNNANYQIAAECITLLKNANNFLPLAAGKRILVTGPAANSMRSLNGGWSRTWQGETSDEFEKDRNTIVEAIRNRFGDANVDFNEGATFEHATAVNEAVSASAKADVIVLCLGETSYTENPGNIDDLNISSPQIELANALYKTGKPIVLVLAEGRPRIVSAIEPFTQAVLHTYFLGNEGGNVVADALIGKINPSGKLPYTYPRYANSLHNYYHKYTEIKQFDEAAGFNPQWEFGFGLSYTTFKYSNLNLSSQFFTYNVPVTVSVDVTNTGKIAGKEVVQLYVSDLVASITPEVKRLKGFDKISLNPGETKTVKFTIDTSDLSLINKDLKRVTEAGEFNVQIRDLSATIKL